MPKKICMPSESCHPMEIEIGVCGGFFLGGSQNQIFNDYSIHCLNGQLIFCNRGFWKQQKIDLLLFLFFILENDF